MIFDAILAAEAERAIEAEAVTEVEATLYEVDSQNVHDTEVNKAVRKIFDSVKIKTPERSEIDVLIRAINSYADSRNGEIGTFDKDNIKRVLDDVSKRNGSVYNVNAKEMDILATVWDEACKKESPESSRNIKDMLLTQLSDTFDKGNTLCPSGFANRVATALIVETPEHFPKTKKIIDAEMLESAAFVRKELESDDEYNKIDDTAQTEMFKTKLNEKLLADYEGILTADDIQKSIAPWIDHV